MRISGMNLIATGELDFDHDGVEEKLKLNLHEGSLLQITRVLKIGHETIYSNDLIQLKENGTKK